jgi:hypothetical protein
MRRFQSWIFAVALLTPVGCGNKISDRSDEDGGQGSGGAGQGSGGAGQGSGGAGQGSGGASGQGGGGASGQGGSGPPGPPSQASLFFVIGPPGVPGAGCAISGNYLANIGGPPRASQGDPGPREVDGVNGARIGCQVTAGPAFQLKASAEKNAVSFLLSDGTISNGAGTGTISVAGPGTAGRQLASENDACQLSASRAPYQIAPGNVWASFDCPLVVSASDPGSRCSVRGEFVFENCEE